MEAQSTAAEVLKPKDTDRSSSAGGDATLQPGPDNVIDETDDVLGRYSGANTGDVATFQATEIASEMFDTFRLSPGSAFGGVTRTPDVMHLSQHQK